MNMPLTPGQDHVIDTIIDRVAAAAAKVQPPAIDKAAQDAAAVNEGATDDDAYARKFLVGAWGLRGHQKSDSPTPAEVHAFALGRRDGIRICRNFYEACPYPEMPAAIAAVPVTQKMFKFERVPFSGNRSDSYQPAVLVEGYPPHDEIIRTQTVAGNRLDTIGHDEPLVKGGQGRNGLEVSESAKWMFIAGALLFVAYVLYRWATGGGA